MFDIEIGFNESFKFVCLAVASQAKASNSGQPLTTIQELQLSKLLRFFCLNNHSKFVIPDTEPGSIFFNNRQTGVMKIITSENIELEWIPARWPE